MSTLATSIRTLVLALAGSGAAMGCLGSSNGGAGPSGPPVIDGGGPPVQTVDGSVLVDGSPSADAGGDSAAPGMDGGIDAASAAAFVTGLGPGVVARSAHFTIITKTGNEPGGAGVKSSPRFTVVSGAAPAATK